jgi:hypothetical protein
MTPKTITLDSTRKTSPTSIFLLALGITLLLVYIIDSLTQIIGIDKLILGSLLAFAIIIIGISIIIYFFGYLFNKLATIADELEQEYTDDKEE